MSSTPKTLDHPLAAALKAAYRQASRDSAFASGGTVPLARLGSGAAKLYYETGDGGSPSVSDLPISAVAAKTLFDAGTPSPHGQGGKTVFDATYRDAHELKPDRFGLNVDVLSALGILQEIAQGADTGTLVAKVNKLNMYHEGGFFKAHKDTPLGNDHVGSIVLCLPSAFTGGALAVKHLDHETVFDFAKYVGGNEPAVSWAFLFSDVEHVVLPVTHGTRIAIAYDVYHVPQTPGAPLDTRTVGITSALGDLLADRKSSGFLAEGGLVGIGLLHGYPSDGDEYDYVENLMGRLKGADKLLVEAIQAANVDWEFNALFSFKAYDCDKKKDVLEYYRSPDFFLVSGQEMGENGGSVEEFGGVLADDVNWIVLPQHFDVSNPYLAYGNEHSIDYVYAAVAVMIELPPVDGSALGPSQLAKNQQKGMGIFAPKYY